MQTRGTIDGFDGDGKVFITWDERPDEENVKSIPSSMRTPYDLQFIERVS